MLYTKSNGIFIGEQKTKNVTEGTIVLSEVVKQVSLSIMLRDFRLQQGIRRSALFWDITQRVVGILYFTI
jgi:hypothetical protein